MGDRRLAVIEDGYDLWPDGVKVPREDEHDPTLADVRKWLLDNPEDLWALLTDLYAQAVGPWHCVEELRAVVRNGAHGRRCAEICAGPSADVWWGIYPEGGSLRACGTADDDAEARAAADAALRDAGYILVDGGEVE